MSWEKIVEVVSKYADSMAEFRTIMNELEFGHKTIYDYPGLSDIINRDYSD